MNILIHPNDYIMRASQLIDEYQFLKAKQVLEELLEKEPAHGQGHHLLAFVLLTGMDNMADAERHYKLAIQFAPRFPYAYRNYAQLLIYGGRYEAAIEVVDQALKMHSIEQSIFYANKGKALELLKRFKEAKTNYKLAIACTTNDHDISNYEEHVKRVKKRIKESTKKERSKKPKKVEQPKEVKMPSRFSTPQIV